jgi:hypothetical protein
MRQSVFITLGLALGIGLVITVTSAAAGVQNAQASVLHSLYGVGTDLTAGQVKCQLPLTAGIVKSWLGFREGRVVKPCAGQAWFSP